MAIKDSEARRKSKRAGTLTKEGGPKPAKPAKPRDVPAEEVEGLALQFGYTQTLAESLAAQTEAGLCTVTHDGDRLVLEASEDRGQPQTRTVDCTPQHGNPRYLDSQEPEPDPGPLIDG